jgi:hypothetical protein
MRQILCALVIACTPPVTPTPDSGDAAVMGDAQDICVRACSNLATIGCLAGADSMCVPACEKNLAAPITVQPLTCWADAGTKEVARACGQLSCP